jgi:nicotinamidase-related amidase
MDYQEAMCRPDGVVGKAGLAAQIEHRGVLGAAAETLSVFRERDEPVIHVRVAFDAGYSRMTSASPRFAYFREHRLLLADAPESAICAEVAPLAAEKVVDKGSVNPFVGTDLAQYLTRLGVGHLALGGVATNHVVEGTARFAADSGYRVTVLEDLCAGNSADLHNFSAQAILPAYADVRGHAEFLEGASR